MGYVVHEKQPELPRSRSKVQRKTAYGRLAEEPLVQTQRFGVTTRSPTTEPRHKSYRSIAAFQKLSVELETPWE